MSATDVHADPDEVYILPQEFYSEQYTFFGHSPGGTWHEDDVVVVLWFVAHPWVVVLIASSLVGGFVAFVYKRWKRKRLAGYLPLPNNEASDFNEQNVEKSTARPARFAFLCHGSQRLRNWLAGEVNFPTSSIYQLGRVSSSIDSNEERIAEP